MRISDWSSDVCSSDLLCMSDSAEKVKKIVVEHLGVEAEKVTEEASFIDDLVADILDIVDLVMAFEEESAGRRVVEGRDGSRGLDLGVSRIIKTKTRYSCRQHQCHVSLIT